MSFIIDTYVLEGIVMAADSRITYTKTTDEEGMQIQRIGVSYNESTNKLFLAPNNVGISFCGEAVINAVPISGIIDTFIHGKLNEKLSVKETADLLLAYFKDLKADLATTFHIAGYQNENNEMQQVMYTINIEQNYCAVSNKQGQQGAKWAGETDVLMRMIKDIGLKNEDGTYSELVTGLIDFSHFTLQDAVDFSMYAVRTTIDTMRFQTRIKTVGGPIDVLVIKPDSAYWLQKKELRIT